jgi:methyl-accepting chemotaxis protein
MKHQIIPADGTDARPALDPRLAKDCGELTVGCSDVGGQIESVAKSLAEQVQSLASLEQVTADLENDQAQVARATEEAKILSAKAAENISASAGQISATVAEFSQITDLIERLGAHVTNFAAAMEQVRDCTASIETIAKTTNMLALNAAIEAERAGDAGRTFAVVASEVKKLASHTRGATEEIRRTVASLSQEAEGLVREIVSGVEESKRAEHGFERIADALSRATDLVGLVDGQSDQIARSAALIHGTSQQMRVALQSHGVAVRANSNRLITAHEQVNWLEQRANAMLDAIVHSDFESEDRRLVTIAIEACARFKDLAETAIAHGKLSVSALFDTDYRLIAGSNPERFDNRANDFADAIWRPALDAIATSDTAIVSCACTDINGYLPTHSTNYSRTPTGDPRHDAAFCRNRLILADATDLIAKASTKAFHIGCYRRNRDDGGYDVVRNVYVPLYINGRRWGDFEIAYRV